MDTWYDSSRNITSNWMKQEIINKKILVECKQIISKNSCDQWWDKRKID